MGKVVKMKQTKAGKLSTGDMRKMINKTAGMKTQQINNLITWL